jgi:ABC-2 type transport system permease protein
MMFLSGVFFSSTKFPDIMQPFIKALPLTALIDGMRLVVNEGQDLMSIVPQLAVLAVWAVVTLVIALRIFRWA